MSKLLKNLAKPWELRPFLLLLLLGLNRIIFRSVFQMEDKPVALTNAIPSFTRECFYAVLIAAVLALSIAIMLKISTNATTRHAPFSDLFFLGLKAQSFYLLAAPFALITLSLSNYFNPSLVYDISKFLKGLFPLSIFITLFFVLKQEFQNLSEIRLLGLVFSPYLLFVGFLVTSLIALAALVILIIVAAILK